MKTRTIRDYRTAAGFKSQKALLAAIGISPKNASFGVALDKGRLPSNHPLLPLVAKALKQSVETIQPLFTDKPLDDKTLRMVATGLQRRLMKAGRNGGRAVVPFRKHNAIVKVERRNSLTRLPHHVRQAARDLANTANANIIAGRSFLEVVPVDAIVLVLDDYFQVRGIKEKMTLSPKYAKAFG